ncbi:MAG: hypothetical protein IJ327_00830 [Lachnospiraceae bacterium]|nr:hypothetical protein [Lachnospiraceae bacterium]
MGKRKNKRNTRTKRKCETQALSCVAEVSVSIEKEETKEAKLTFTQRKDRFLVVATVIGLLVLVWKFFGKVSIEFISKFPLKSVNVWGIENFLLTYDQIISIIYFAIHILQC